MAKKNELTLIKVKTKQMIFGTQLILNQCHDVKVRSNGHVIENGEIFKYLGIILYRSLNCDTQWS